MKNFVLLSLITAAASPSVFAEDILSRYTCSVVCGITYKQNKSFFGYEYSGDTQKNISEPWTASGDSPRSLLESFKETCDKQAHALLGKLNTKEISFEIMSHGIGSPDDANKVGSILSWAIDLDKITDNNFDSACVYNYQSKSAASELSLEQMFELNDSYSWTSKSYEKVNGYLFTAPKNPVFLAIPASAKMVEQTNYSYIHRKQGQFESQYKYVGIRGTEAFKDHLDICQLTILADDLKSDPSLVNSLIEVRSAAINTHEVFMELKGGSREINLVCKGPNVHQWSLKKIENLLGNGFEFRE